MTNSTRTNKINTFATKLFLSLALDVVKCFGGFRSNERATGPRGCALAYCTVNIHPDFVSYTVDHDYYEVAI